MNSTFRILLLCFLFHFNGHSQQRAEASLPNTARVEMQSGEGLEYIIYVSLPASYDTSSEVFPVVYVLDADLTFGMAHNTRVLMSYGREIPEVILVGIAYKEGFENVHSNRFRDLTPTAWSSDKIGQFSGINGINDSGGADSFLKFIDSKLKKFMKENYRVDEDNETLVGYSLSGLFAIHVASKKEEHFNNYLIASPSLWWYESDLNKILSGISNTKQKKLIYTSVGSNENPEVMIEPWKIMTETFKNPGANIELHSEILEGESHVTSFNRAFPNGIKKIFGNHTKQ